MKDFATLRYDLKNPRRVFLEGPYNFIGLNNQEKATLIKESGFLDNQDFFFLKDFVNEIFNFDLNLTILFNNLEKIKTISPSSTSFFNYNCEINYNDLDDYHIEPTEHELYLNVYSSMDELKISCFHEYLHMATTSRVEKGEKQFIASGISLSKPLFNEEDETIVLDNQFNGLNEGITSFIVSGLANEQDYSYPFAAVYVQNLIINKNSKIVSHYLNLNNQGLINELTANQSIEQLRQLKEELLILEKYASFDTFDDQENFAKANAKILVKAY